MRKYGLIVDPRSRLLRATYANIPLLVLETIAFQQACSKVDPVQELMKPCQEMSAEKIKSLKKTLHDYCDVFTQHENNLGKNQINTDNHSPIKPAPRWVPLTKCKLEEMESLIQSMKGPGIIEPSSSPWSSPLTLVPKKDGTTRFCVNYWKLNEIRRKDSYPLPHIDDIFDVFHGWFCPLDLKNGFWQVEVSFQTERRQYLQPDLNYGNSQYCHSDSAMHQQPLNGWWK